MMHATPTVAREARKMGERYVVWVGHPKEDEWWPNRAMEKREADRLVDEFSARGWKTRIVLAPRLDVEDLVEG